MGSDEIEMVETGIEAPIATSRLLTAAHAAYLAERGVSAEVAIARGYRSVANPADLPDEWAGASDEITDRISVGGEALAIPLYSVDDPSSPSMHQLRLDDPRRRPSESHPEGKVIKFEAPRGAKRGLEEGDIPADVHPLAQGDALGDASLIFTEGIPKGDALLSAARAEGLRVVPVSFTGVTMAYQTDGDGSRSLHPFLCLIPLHGREVYLCWDSDWVEKRDVRITLFRTGDLLTQAGAEVHFVSVPPLEHSGKTGVDDWLAADPSHTLSHLLDRCLLTDDEVADLAKEPTRGGGKRPTAKRATADVLMDIALAEWRLGQTPAGEPFAVTRNGPRLVLPFRGGRFSLRSALSALHIDQEGKVPSQSSLADCLVGLEGLAARAEPEELHLRVARAADGAIWLDLGDQTGQAVRITAAGWDLGIPPMLFRRTALTAALPVPEGGGSLDDLWPLIRVATQDRPLLLAWLVSALDPSIPHPILTVTGEYGSAKSTGARQTASLIDPSPAQLRKPPRDEESWVTSVAGSWIVAVDNVSRIDTQWSDGLCRAVTGDGDVRRRLYTDGDLTVWAFRRVIILNGIDLGSLRGDLVNRLLSIELNRVEPTKRLLDAEVAERWKAAWPRLLGALLDLAVQVMAVLPSVHLDELPRMADFARVLAAVDQVLGTDGMATWTGQADRLAADVVEGDAVLREIARCIVRPWTGTAAELISRLGDRSDLGRAWPTNGRAMTGRLRRGAPVLRSRGWAVDQAATDHRGTAIWTITPPPATKSGDEPGGDQTADPAEDSAEYAPKTDDAPKTAPDSAGVSAPQNSGLTCDDAETPKTPRESTSSPLSRVKEREGEERAGGGRGDDAESFGVLGVLGAGTQEAEPNGSATTPSVDHDAPTRTYTAAELAAIRQPDRRWRTPETADRHLARRWRLRRWHALGLVQAEPTLGEPSCLCCLVAADDPHPNKMCPHHLDHAWAWQREDDGGLVVVGGDLFLHGSDDPRLGVLRDLADEHGLVLHISEEWSIHCPRLSRPGADGAWTTAVFFARAGEELPMALDEADLAAA